MTDNEIIKALEYCKDCSANINSEILDLINRQKAEIERLNTELVGMRGAGFRTIGTFTILQDHPTEKGGGEE